MYLSVDKLNPLTLLLLITGCDGPWLLTSSLLTKTGRGKDLSNDTQIRVIGSVEPEICMKMLKNVSETLGAKFPATTDSILKIVSLKLCYFL